MASISETVLESIIQQFDQETLLGLATAYLRQEGFRVREASAGTVEISDGDGGVCARVANTSELFAFAFGDALGKERQELIEAGQSDS